MSHLPRVLGYLDASMASRDRLDADLASFATAGSEVAIVARHPGATAEQLSQLTLRAVAAAHRSRASVYTSGRSDIARACRADGVVLRRDDLPASEMSSGLVTLAAVHSLAEAQQAAREGVQALIVGTIWPSASHPGRPGAGLELVSAVAALDLPVFAIGGVTPERAGQAVAAGAWGVAAIGSIWHDEEPGTAAIALLKSIRKATRFGD